MRIYPEKIDNETFFRMIAKTGAKFRTALVFGGKLLQTTNYYTIIKD